MRSATLHAPKVLWLAVAATAVLLKVSDQMLAVIVVASRLP